MKSVILSKSCSRCGGSIIFKGRALQKSVRDPVRGGVRKKHGQKRTCRALRGRLGHPPENRPPSGRPPRRPKNFKIGVFSCARGAPGAHLFEGLSQNARRSPPQHETCPETAENRSKIDEKTIGNRSHHPSKFLQKSSINSEEKRWATPSAGQAFLGCGGLALAS